MTVSGVGSGLGVKFGAGVVSTLAGKVGQNTTTALAQQGVSAEVSNITVNPAQNMKVSGANVIGEAVGTILAAAIVAYTAKLVYDWVQTGEFSFLPRHAAEPESEPRGNWSKTKDTQNGNKLLQIIYGTEVDPNLPERFRTDAYYEELEKQRKKQEQIQKNMNQHIYDTKAAEAFAKLNMATKKSASNASTAGTAFEQMGRSISRSSSSAYDGIISGSTKAFTNVTNSSNTASNNANKNLNAIRNTAGNAFSFNVWSTYGDNIKNSLGSSIDDVKARWESLQKSMSSSVQVSGTSSGGGSSVVTYVTTTTSTPKAVTNIDAPGIKSNPTWHNLPTKPSGMPESAWASYLENWKKNNPGNFYAQGGFPEIASLFWAGENGVPELLGTVGGKTAVAGGSEITGIRDAIVQTAGEEIGVLRQQNTLLQAILEKEFGISNDALFRSVRNSANDFRMRTGRGAF